MKLTTVLFLTVIALASCVQSEVIQLKQANFNSTIAENQYVLVMYYDPFNSLCKKFLPKFKRLSESMTNITFAKLNGEKEVDLADEQGVDDYPSFELFVWGVPIKYMHHDSVSALKEWIANKTLVEYSTANSADDLSDQDFELYFSSASDDSEIAKIMTGLQIKHTDMKIYRVSPSFAQTLAQSLELQVEGEEVVFCVRKHDKHAAVYSGEIRPYPLESWIVANEYPDVSEFGPRTIHWLEKEELPVLFFFYDPSSVNATWVDYIKQNAKDGKSIALTVLADITREDVQTFATQNGFSVFPMLVIIEPDTPTKRYLCKKKLKKIYKNTALDCLHDFEARDLRRFYKSEEPVEGLDRNVRYVVGKKFGKQIFSNFDNFNLVMFYNSSTTHLLDQYKAFAEKIGEVKEFNFNAFNQDLNEHRQVLHITAGTLMLLSPDDDNVNELDLSEGVDETKILTFLEDKAPNDIYELIYKAYQQE